MRQGEAISSKCLLTTYGKSNMKVICNLFFFFSYFHDFYIALVWPGRWWWSGVEDWWRGSSCHRADHGIAITEANQASFLETGQGEHDFGNEGSPGRKKQQGLLIEPLDKLVYITSWNVLYNCHVSFKLIEFYIVLFRENRFWLHRVHGMA